MFDAVTGWNTVPSTQIRWSITAIRRAKATIAHLRPRRCASWAPQFLSHVDLPRFIVTVAVWHSARLRLVSPALVMPPDTSRSPDWLREGVRPVHGPTFFEEAKRAGSSTAEQKVTRIICAIPRESSGSVLFTCALRKAFAWHVSIQITGSPAGASPSNNQCDSGPASNPIRLKWPPMSLKARESSSGWFAIFISEQAWLSPSTTKNGGFFYRDIQSGIMFHATSPSLMVVAASHKSRIIISSRRSTYRRPRLEVGRKPNTPSDSCLWGLTH